METPNETLSARVHELSPDKSLSARVDELIQSRKGPLLSTTGVQMSIEELARRDTALEIAIREIALEVDKLTPSQGA